MTKDGPLDGPGIKIDSKEFKDMVMNLMLKKHMNPEDSFDLFEEE
tara:strand:- start:369 stop:503 length:135 start_codon:yes stop_codon:yes gene_type:complete